MIVYEVWGAKITSLGVEVTNYFYPTKDQAIRVAKAFKAKGVRKLTIVDDHNRQTACDLLNGENFLLKSETVWGQDPPHYAHI